MKKLFLLIILFMGSTGLLLNAKEAKEVADLTTKGHELAAKGCPAAAPSYRLPEDLDEGDWIADNSVCNQYKWMGPQPEGTVCVESCTSDGLEEAGID